MGAAVGRPWLCVVLAAADFLHLGEPLGQECLARKEIPFESLLLGSRIR